ncbi:centromere protein M isoform X3 [Syngnathoides biaculeatus]|uniref:centromere protein M isoform X3 n=1 Tax=Syngnathoides biaculeatus TaxID=300417 RepID=UPI002ADD52E1|nr:centromere protein M isoform X3 [Syngnathoides biaculeatus]
MSLLNPFSRLPDLNTATILLVEREEEFQERLAEILVEEKAFTLKVRLAKSLPLPAANDGSRPRIDLVVFIINLTSDLSLQSAEASVKYLDPDYFLGKVCFMATNDGRWCERRRGETGDHPEGGGRSRSHDDGTLSVQRGDDVTSALGPRSAGALSDFHAFYVLCGCTRPPAFSYLVDIVYLCILLCSQFWM